MEEEKLDLQMTWSCILKNKEYGKSRANEWIYQGCRIKNQYMSVLFLYTSNQHDENEIKKTIPF